MKKWIWDVSGKEKINLNHVTKFVIEIWGQMAKVNVWLSNYATYTVFETSILADARRFVDECTEDKEEK